MIPYNGRQQFITAIKHVLKSSQSEGQHSRADSDDTNNGRMDQSGQANTLVSSPTVQSYCLHVLLSLSSLCLFLLSCGLLLNANTQLKLTNS